MMRIVSSIIALAAAATLSLAAPAATAETDARQSMKTEVGQPVVLHTDIVVEGDTVTLGHLFGGLGQKAATPIARAPEPGKEVRLPASWLGRVARAYAIDWKPMSKLQEATLRRAALRIDGRRIAEAIQARIDARDAGSELAVQLDSPGVTLNLPVTVEPGVEIAALQYDPETGRFTANVMAPNAERPLASATVSGRAVAMVEVPVLSHQIGRGEIIGERDITWTTLEANRLNRNHVVDPDRIIGKSARRSLQPEEPLRDTDIEAPVLVSKSSLVTLVVQTERMRLTTQGRALENGAEGDVVRVINTKSNTTLNGVVLADGIVSVLPSGRRAQFAKN